LRYLLITISLIASLVALVLAAPAGGDISGTWQGVIDGPAGPARRVMIITKNLGGYNVAIHSIDESDVPIVTHDVSVRGSAVVMKFDMNTDPWTDYKRTYVANVAATGKSMSGKWSIPGGPVIPTMYEKVTRASWTWLEPKTTYVPVQRDVKVEALDWGGFGRPVLLLAGLGNTGHDFMKLIPGLRERYHVYSMTRRGFGRSSAPAPSAANYGADRLADDVLAVMTTLHIDKPVLIGHSIAGEELTDIGVRYRNKVAGLVYLDAGYWYAFRSAASTPEPLGTTPPGAPPMPPIGKAVLEHEGRVFNGAIDVPILAIFADPHDLHGHYTGAKLAAEEAKDKKETDAIAAAFERGQPTAKVIRIPNANHFLYISNTDEVLRDINAFIGALPQN